MLPSGWFLLVLLFQSLLVPLLVFWGMFQVHQPSLVSTSPSYSIVIFILLQHIGTYPSLPFLIYFLDIGIMVCSSMVWVQSQVESYQRFKKWYLMPPCLTLSIIRYGSRVKLSNLGKVVPSPTPCCSSYRKGRLRVTRDFGRQLFFFFNLFSVGMAKSIIRQVFVFLLTIDRLCLLAEIRWYVSISMT